jgi:DNA-binding NtrC family response regulator
MVYGFARRYGGDIKVYSEKGVGTTFRLYLPRDTAEKPAATANQTGLMPQGSELILIVDDEVDLLRLANQYLQSLGYRTLTANNAHAAIELLKEDLSVDLLFTDVVMPGDMNGYQLAEAAVKLSPTLKVLLTSGFTANTIAVNGQARFNSNLLHKPYRKSDLATHVRSVLDEGKRA